MRMIGKMAAWVTVVWMTAACTGMTVHHEKGELVSGRKAAGATLLPHTGPHPEWQEWNPYRKPTVSFWLFAGKPGYAYFATYYRPNGKSLLHYRHKMSGSEVFYTHHTPAGTYEVGIIYIRDSVTNAKGIREVHFVETVKPKKNNDR